MTEEWLRQVLTCPNGEIIEEPGGVLACSPKFYNEMLERDTLFFKMLGQLDSVMEQFRLISICWDPAEGE
jgi:hypothetical protein